VTGKSQTVGSVTKSVSYGYTSGNLTALTTPSGQSVLYSYNSNHQVTGVAVNGTTVLSSVLYDPFGPVRGWTWGNATLAVRTYDADGKITQVDSAGLKTYGYDDAFRITGITDTVDSALSWTYGYDLLDRLTSGTKTGLSQTFTYDANGNRLTQGGTASSTYTISSTSNRLSSVSGALSRTYGYDAAGNTTSDGALSFTYNNAGRMKTSVTGGVTTSYGYNALGQRVKKSGGAAGTVLYWYDEAGHLLGEYDGSGNLIQETVWLGDIPVATLRPGSPVALYYVHTDHLNTPRKVSRSSDNALLWRWDSDPFGTTAPNENPASLGTFHYNLRFPGQYFDAESGLSYNYFRDYDPGIGRYIESDPIGLKGGLNTYTYASQVPLLSVDPLGLADFTAGWIECDRGKLIPKAADLGPIDTRCGVRKCVLEHEMQHVRDFRPFQKHLCRIFGPGEMVRATSRAQAQSEVNAYQVSVDCLKTLLIEQGCSRECSIRIQELITDAEQRRDAWRSQLPK